jgi:hypothetical protein
MPVSSGLRSRPQIGFARPLSHRSDSVSSVAKIVPRNVLFPIAMIACVTAFAAVFWTHDIHTNDTLAGIEAPTVTGTIGKTN